MSDFFGFTERYLSTDGKEWIDASCVREALGIGEDYNADILGEIKKLKKERDGLKADLDLTNRLYKENRKFIDKVCDAVDITRPCTESGYDRAVKSIAEIKKERDELKEKCDKMKKRANAVYGVSCGKEPAFLCDVISYSWNFGALDTPFPNNSIRVELNLTPTANYKGTFDLEDLKHYIQAYGREKKLGVVESIDYQNAKAARAELAYLYKQVLGKEKLDRDLSPHEVMKAILDEYDKREDFIRELSCSLGFGDPVVKPDNIDQKEKDILERIESLKDGVWPCENSSTFAEHLRKEFPKFCKRYNVVPLMNASIHDWIQYIFDVLSKYRGMRGSGLARAEKLIKDKRAVEDSLAELRAKIREIYRSVVDDEWDGRLSYTSALNDINEEYKRVVHNFEERTADWHKAQQEFDRYELAVNSLLDIPKETRDNINAIERSFTFSKKKYESLKEFRDNVCEIFDIPSNMTDNYILYILKEIHDVVDRYDELEDFRADICGALDIEGMLGTPQQNNKYILEQVEKLKKTPNQDAFRYAICNALDMPTTVIDGNIIGRIHLIQDRCDKLARLRSSICTALCLGGETSDEDILEEVEKLIEFRDAVAKAIGMDYPTTNNFILKRVSDIYKERGESHDLAMELDRKCIDLTAKNSDLKQKFEFQSGLRQQWHARYDSEHERANCVQKALDREREKCRVKDISLETAKKQYEKVCSNLETAECALNGMKSKMRSLQEEKTKVITALGQDIWDDAVN